MDDYDIYYVDSRNATVRDHRPGMTRPTVWGGRPAVATPTRTVYASPPPIAQGFAPISTSYQTTPVYQPAPAYPQGIWYPGPVGGTMATLFGKLTTGEIVDMIAQVWGALQALPRAPSPSSDAETDVANLVTLCRARHNVTYAERRIMPRGSDTATEVHVKARHDQSPSRKARSWSFGLNRRPCVLGGAVRAIASSLALRSASR